MSRSDLVDLIFESELETDKAICVSEDGGKTKVWLPKSQIEFEIKGFKVEVTLPEWLASEKKFAGY